MSKRERILDLIKNRRNIPISLIDFIDITRDGNYLFIATSFHLYGNEDKYKEIRITQIIISDLKLWIKILNILKYLIYLMLKILTLKVIYMQIILT